jgi:osmotically-inducible protein OsmY
MRRRFAGLAMLAIFAATHSNLQADDREVAQQIIQQLKSHRDAGRLKGFKVDMKVDDGVVLFKGNVVNPAQRDLVLRAAEGISGVTRVVNEITVQPSPQAELVATKPVAVSVPANTAAPAIAQAAPQATSAAPTESETAFLRDALRSVTPVGFNEQAKQRSSNQRSTNQQQANQPTGPSDQDIRAAIVSRIGQAKSDGQVSGFGLNVTVERGVAQLRGNAREEETRAKLLEIVSMTPGVTQVVEDIALPQSAFEQPITPVAHVSAAAGAAGSLPLPEPENSGTLSQAPAPIVASRQSPAAQNRLQPVAVQNARGAVVPASAAPVGRPAMPPQGMPGRPVSMNGGAVYGGQMGAPVPMYPAPQAGCNASGPHMDGPNMPNYAWPGYAAHPNYAALTYPQQYSPSAWPYIGPFYPYPQVPLGWRKVSLEWDDGWWMLDFTDR